MPVKQFWVKRAWFWFQRRGKAIDSQDFRIGDLIIPGHDRPFTFDSKHGVKYIMGYDIEFNVNINPVSLSIRGKLMMRRIMLNQFSRDSWSILLCHGFFLWP